MKAPRTRDEQKILNTRLRLAIAYRCIPFRFIDDQEALPQDHLQHGCGGREEVHGQQGWQRVDCESGEIGNKQYAKCGNLKRKT